MTDRQSQEQQNKLGSGTGAAQSGHNVELQSSTDNSNTMNKQTEVNAKLPTPIVHNTTKEQSGVNSESQKANDQANTARHLDEPRTSNTINGEQAVADAGDKNLDHERESSLQSSNFDESLTDVFNEDSLDMESFGNDDSQMGDHTSDHKENYLLVKRTGKIDDPHWLKGKRTRSLYKDLKRFCGTHLTMCFLVPHKHEISGGIEDLGIVYLFDKTTDMTNNLLFFDKAYKRKASLMQSLRNLCSPGLAMCEAIPESKLSVDIRNLVNSLHTTPSSESVIQSSNESSYQNQASNIDQEQLPLSTIKHNVTQVLAAPIHQGQSTNRVNQQQPLSTTNTNLTKYLNDPINLQKVTSKEHQLVPSTKHNLTKALYEPVYEGQSPPILTANKTVTKDLNNPEKQNTSTSTEQHLVSTIKPNVIKTLNEQMDQTQVISQEKNPMSDTKHDLTMALNQPMNEDQKASTEKQPVSITNSIVTNSSEEQHAGNQNQRTTSNITKTSTPTPQNKAMETSEGNV